MKISVILRDTLNLYTRLIMLNTKTAIFPKCVLTITVNIYTLCCRQYKGLH